MHMAMIKSFLRLLLCQLSNSVNYINEKYGYEYTTKDLSVSDFYQC